MLSLIQMARLTRLLCCTARTVQVHTLATSLLHAVAALSPEAGRAVAASILKYKLPSSAPVATLTPASPAVAPGPAPAAERSISAPLSLSFENSEADEDLSVAAEALRLSSLHLTISPRQSPPAAAASAAVGGVPLRRTVTLDPSDASTPDSREQQNAHRVGSSSSRAARMTQGSASASSSSSSSYASPVLRPKPAAFPAAAAPSSSPAASDYSTSSSNHTHDNSRKRYGGVSMTMDEDEWLYNRQVDLDAMFDRDPSPYSSPPPPPQHHQHEQHAAGFEFQLSPAGANAISTWPPASSALAASGGGGPSTAFFSPVLAKRAASDCCHGDEGTITNPGPTSAGAVGRQVATHACSVSLFHSADFNNSDF